MLIRYQFLQGSFVVCRFPAGCLIPLEPTGEFWSVTHTRDETSLVCMESIAPTATVRESGFCCLKIEGPLDFGLTGILAKIATTLAEADVPIFAISTFDTDYVLLRIDLRERADRALKAAGLKNVGAV